MRRSLPFLAPLAALVFSLAVYDRLPDRVPTHWGMDGRVDGWSSRAVAAFGFPVMMLLVGALMRWLPSIDPRRANYEKFRSTYDALVASVLGFMAVIHGAVLGSAIGWPISVEMVVLVGMGALFLVIGNLLPRARPNWFVGVRTPWTLSSERVWERTHRVAGAVFMLCGVAFIVAAVLQIRLALLFVIGLTTVGALATVAYSYVLWRRERPS